MALAFIWTDGMARTVTPGREWLAHPGFRWPDDAFDNRRYALQGIVCRVMSIASLVREKERYERYSGRPLRERDLVSMKLLRSLLS